MYNKYNTLSCSSPKLFDGRSKMMKRNIYTDFVDIKPRFQQPNLKHLLAATNARSQPTFWTLDTALFRIRWGNGWTICILTQREYLWNLVHLLFITGIYEVYYSQVPMLCCQMRYTNIELRKFCVTDCRPISRKQTNCSMQWQQQFIVTVIWRPISTRLSNYSIQ